MSNAKLPVFIVDDDEDDRISIRDAFIENKHHKQYVFMESGEQLIYHLKGSFPHNHPSVILLDLNMPGKNGRDVLREIKMNDRLKRIPVVIFTTSSSEGDRISSYELGANCFIAKPNSYQELMEITQAIAKLWF